MVQWGIYSPPNNDPDSPIWSTPKPAEKLIPRLGFIKDKESWYAYFQGGIHQIDEDDYKAITMTDVAFDEHRHIEHPNLSSRKCLQEMIAIFVNNLLRPFI